MTDKEIEARVEGWNWNLNIFEIYDEVKEMSSYVGYRGTESSHSDLTRLLNHAYEYFKYDPAMYELMSHLGVEVEEDSKADLTTTS
tara:strand:+ start:14100 stop:14357 length:258 start_codon:yes stop_codon:yes gene_type:complete